MRTEDADLLDNDSKVKHPANLALITTTIATTMVVKPTSKGAQRLALPTNLGIIITQP